MIRDYSKLKDRDFSNGISNDIIIKKRIIKQIFLQDKDLLEALHNKNLSIESPDDFLDENIFSYLKLNGIQDEVKNFILFDIDDINVSYDNNVIKNQVLTVMCLVHENEMKTTLNIDRHDLLAYIVIDLLNWSNVLGMQLKLIYNQSDIIDMKYYCRTVKFKMNAPNNLNNGGINRYDRLT